MTTQTKRTEDMTVADTLDAMFGPATAEQAEKSRQAARIAVCQEWERITGAPGRYRISVYPSMRGCSTRVEIAQFRAPLDCPTVGFGPGNMIKLDPMDMARFAQRRGISHDALYSEIVDFCRSLHNQWSELAILDSSESA
jgi:hypothetical protein